MSFLKQFAPPFMENANKGLIYLLPSISSHKLFRTRYFSVVSGSGVFIFQSPTIITGRCVFSIMWFHGYKHPLSSDTSCRLFCLKHTKVQNKKQIYPKIEIWRWRVFSCRVASLSNFSLIIYPAAWLKTQTRFSPSLACTTHQWVIMSVLLHSLCRLILFHFGKSY